MEKITSLQNQKVKEWCSYHIKKKRDESKKFLIEGEHLITEALKENIVETILYEGECPFPFDNKIEVTKEILKKISDNPSGAKYIAICKQEEKEITNFDRILILDGIQDPGNLGTLIRTAVSFSFDGIYCSLDTCDLYNEKTIRSTQGALFEIPIVRKDLDTVLYELHEKNVFIIATALRNAMSMNEVKPKEKMAFILGNEGQGVSNNSILNSDICMKIPMHGFESLNVAVAGGIVMYEYQKKD